MPNVAVIGGRRLALVLVLCLGALGALGASGAAEARAGFITGLSGYEFQSSDPAERTRGMTEAREAGARVVRLNVGWSAIAQAKPADAADPADPAYGFRSLDAAVQSAAEQGLEPLLTVQSAPAFAEGANRPASAAVGSWKPDAEAMRQFAEALARRYSGSFEGLPRVRYFQAWNEPNLSVYITPQYNGKREVAAGIYRRLLNGFYEGVKSVERSNVVVSGGTAPYGDTPGGQRTRPLAFIRELLCVRKGGGKTKKCSGKAKFDILAHHPINTSGGPTQSAIHPDDVTTPDFKNIRSIVRQAERKRTIGTPGKHQLWATEIWIESNPPDRKRGVPLATQARHVQQTLYLLWKQGAGLVMNLEVRDPPPSDDVNSIDAGLYFADGGRKPAFTAYRFPFVTDRASAGKLRAWGRPPVGGSLEIQLQRGNGYRTIERLEVGAGKVFSTKVSAGDGSRLRAVIGGETSLVWKQR